MTVVRRNIVRTIGLIILICSFLICFSGEVNAAPSSENIGENKTYKEGSHYVLVKKGNAEYAKAKITLSRETAPGWNEIKESSTEWNISSNKEEIVPAAKKVSTICKGKWPDGYIVPSVYTDGEFTAEDNVYAYLFYDIKIKIPKGWRYDTYKIRTKATDCANHLGLPEDTKTAESSDRTVTGKYHINIVVSGLRTMEKIRYTGSEYDIILKANECNVTYNSNGGSGNMTAQTVTYETASKLKANSFVRQGYRFTGWNTKKDGSGKAFADAADISKAFPSASRVTMYAQWKEIKPAKITLSRAKVIGEKGKTTSIKANVTPSDAKDKTVTFTSSDSSVVSVKSDGTLSFNKAGNAVITAKTSNGLTVKSRVCVYSAIKDADVLDIKGYTKEKTDLLDYGYAKSSVMRSAAKNESLSIIGECGSYYYVKMDKDSKTGFLGKDKIKIPAVALKIKGGKLTLKKNQKRNLKVKYVPAITTEKTLTWKSSSKKTASITKKGVLTGKNIGAFNVTASINNSTNKVGASKGGEVKGFKGNTGWINHKDIEERITWKKKKGNSKKTLDKDEKMQGLTGYGKTIYFIKQHRVNKKEKKAKIYKAKIIDESTGKYKIEKAIYTFPENKQLGHANGMAAIKEKGKVQLYVAPCRKYYRFVYKVEINGKNLGKRVKKLDIKSSKLANGKNFNANSIKKISSVAAWKYKGKQYLIVNCTYDLAKDKKRNYVFAVSKNKIECKYIFKTPVPYYQDGNYAAQQGSAVSGDNKYYLVVSHGKKTGDTTDDEFHTIWNKSFVFKFKLKEVNSKIEAISEASYRFVAGNKIKKRKGRSATTTRRLEMEDMYIYKSKGKTRLFFNSEGSNNYLDFLGSFGE